MMQSHVSLHPHVPCLISILATLLLHGDSLNLTQHMQQHIDELHDAVRSLEAATMHGIMSCKALMPI